MRNMFVSEARQNPCIAQRLLCICIRFSRDGSVQLIGCCSRNTRCEVRSGSAREDRRDHVALGFAISMKSESTPDLLDISVPLDSGAAMFSSGNAENSQVVALAVRLNATGC